MTIATALVTVMLQVGDSAPSHARTPDSRITRLEGLIDGLKSRIEVLEADLLKSKIDVLSLKNTHKTVWLDTSSRAFQRLNDDTGDPFAISLDTVEPYLDGYKASLSVGNLSSGTYEGFQLAFEWAPEFPSPWTASEAKKWSAAKQARTFPFTDSLKPGRWTKVEIVLPKTSSSDLGYFTVSIKTSVLSLTR